VNDWYGLTKDLLSRTFSKEFLTSVEDTDNYFSLKVISIDLSEYINMLEDAKPRDPMEKTIEQLKPPKGVSIYAKIPFVSTDSFLNMEEDIEAQALYQEVPFKVTSITIKCPAFQGHGISVQINGTKSRDFTIRQARLVIEGNQFWDTLGNLLGSVIMSTFRHTLHPVILCPTYMNPNSISKKSTSVNTTISFGTGQNNSSVKFKDTTFLSKLKEIVEKGDPQLSLVIEYGDDDYGWSTVGELARIQTKPSLILEAIQSNRNLLA